MIPLRRVTVGAFFAAVLSGLVLMVAHAQESKKVAVLELRNAAGLTPEENEYLTDLVRDAASRVLGGRGFLVVTRSTLYELLPPGTDLSKCDTEKCVAETGRTIGVDYIVQGEVLKFQGEYRFKAGAFHSYTTAFLGSQTAGGKTVKEIEKEITGASTALFGLVLRHAGGGSQGPGRGEEGKIGGGGSGPGAPPVGEDVVVRFDSQPGGAVVEADDQMICDTTPCSQPLVPGRHTVSMKKMRHETRRESVDVTPGMKQLSWALSPNFGWLTVTSSPAGLAVRINGKETGRTPLTAQELDPGFFEVVVSDPRYVEAGERINLGKGERKTVAVTLTPREGWIKVQAVDDGKNAVEGEVWADGSKAGKTYAPIAVLVGSHEVEVRSPSGSWSGKVEVREKEVTAVAAKVAGGTARSTSGIEMVLIRPGTFTMGSPSSEPGRENDETQHTVTITRGFYLGRTEVTQGQWKAVMGNNPSHFSSCGDDCPVESVSWTEAVEFCNKLSDREGLSRCFRGSGSDATWDQGCTGYRLPTEAEWEYAARAGTTTAFSTGTCLSTDQANYNGNDPQQGCPKGRYRRTTVKVGSFAPNAWGVYDTIGNVWEWTWDWYDAYLGVAATDPVGAGGGWYRVDRGGSWSSNAQYCRSADRYYNDPGYRSGDLGFRLARSAR